MDHAAVAFGTADARHGREASAPFGRSRSGGWRTPLPETPTGDVTVVYIEDSAPAAELLLNFEAAPTASEVPRRAGGEEQR
jgi:hypothetical protein